MCRPPRLSPAASAASRNGAGSVASRGDGVSFAASDGTRSDAEESSSEASYAATGSHGQTATFLERSPVTASWISPETHICGLLQLLSFTSWLSRLMTVLTKTR